MTATEMEFPLTTAPDPLVIIGLAESSWRGLRSQPRAILFWSLSAGVIIVPNPRFAGQARSVIRSQYGTTHLSGDAGCRRHASRDSEISRGEPVSTHRALRHAGPLSRIGGLRESRKINRSADRNRGYSNRRGNDPPWYGY